MKKTTLFLFSLLLSIGAMAQEDPAIVGVRNIPTEKVDLSQGLQTGYYLLKQVNDNASAAGGQGVGYIKAADEAVDASATSKDTGTPSATDNTYIWYVEVVDVANKTITISTANKVAAWQTPYQHQKNLVAYAERATLKYHTETVNLSGNATPKEGSCFLSTQDGTAYVHFSGDNLGSWNDTNQGSMFMVEFYKLSEDDLAYYGERYGYVYNTGRMNRELNKERGLTSFTLTDGANSLEVSNIQDVVSRTAPVYADRSAEKLTTKQGATLKFTEFNYTGSWMHAYAYIDYNKDFEFNLTNNNNGEGEGEIVSYNYYEGKTIIGGAGDTEGNALTKMYDGSKAMPAFTLPANLQAGEYRMRIKIDWDNLDADYGASDIAANGGCQCDITIVVESSVPRRVSVVAGAGGSVSIEGETGTEVEVVGNVNIIATPDYGYEFVNWKKGDEVVSTAASYVYNGAEEANFVAEFRRLTIDEQYSLLSQPTFKLSDGNITEISQIEFNGSNITGFQTALGTTKHLNDVIKVRAGGIYKLTIGYELHWGDIALYQIDNNGTQTKYGPYLCAWEADANPLNILKRDNSTMYEDFGLNSLDDFEVVSSGGNTYMWLPYEISIDEDHKPGDLVTLRIVAATPKAATASEDYTQGRCFDILLEVVPTYPLSVSAAGWASLYLDFPAEIPDFGNEDEEAGVYIVTGVKEGNWLNLVKVTEGVLPANTGVIVKAAQGTHDFMYSEEGQADVSGNLLKGSVVDEYIEGKAYVLGNKSGIGFYQAELNKNATGNAGNTHFKNNAYKSYLLATDIPAMLSRSAAAFRFAFSGTTAVEDVEIVNEKEEIYDLAGRRLSEITKPGIYIINGKKVLVK